jgi:hypothetical protein
MSIKVPDSQTLPAAFTSFSFSPPVRSDRQRETGTETCPQAPRVSDEPLVLCGACMPPPFPGPLTDSFLGVVTGVRSMPHMDRSTMHMRCHTHVVGRTS